MPARYSDVSEFDSTWRATPRVGVHVILAKMTGPTSSIVTARSRQFARQRTEQPPQLRPTSLRLVSDRRGPTWVGDAPGSQARVSEYDNTCSAAHRDSMRIQATCTPSLMSRAHVHVDPSDKLTAYPGVALSTWPSVCRVARNAIVSPNGNRAVR